MKYNFKDLSLINILAIIFTFIIFLLIGILLIKNYSLSKKISKTINQHESIYRFIVAYHFMCKTALFSIKIGKNYKIIKTSDEYDKNSILYS